jgi:hypothetical protein
VRPDRRIPASRPKMSGDFAEVYLASHHYHLSFPPEQFAHGGPVAQRRLKQPLVYSAEYDAMRGPHGLPRVTAAVLKAVDLTGVT